MTGEWDSLSPSLIPIDVLRPGDTARMGNLDEGHLAVITGLAGSWPPLLVTSRGDIIDGHYRYAAAQRLGLTDLVCTVFDGDGFDAFVEGVRRNIPQGLPLALRERKAAARRILTMHPEWSDRRVAELCGLAHQTVGRMRFGEGRQPGAILHLDSRRGRDGKAWVRSSSEVERRIREAIAERPEASLREIARLAGTTHETVRAYRRRANRAVARGPAPVEAAGSATAFGQIAPVGTASPVEPALDRAAAPSGANSPARDDAFTSTAEGASFAAWFERTANDAGRQYVQSIPLSRVYEIEDEARRRARMWSDFATALTARVRGNCK
jgi:ParB-like chromosome segregation protein Spo0J